MNEIMLVEERDVEGWRKAVEVLSYRDMKGAEAVRYLNERDACRTFQVAITHVVVPSDASPSVVIKTATGAAPEIYSPDALRAEIAHRSVAWPKSTGVTPGDVLRSARRIAAQTPSLQLLRPSVTGWGRRELGVIPQSAVVGDGEVAALRRNSVAAIVDRAHREVWSAQFHTAARMMFVRDADDFVSLVRSSLNALGEEAPRMSRYSALDDSSRPKVAVLYTDEDLHVAAYVRSHAAVLDRASGEHCDLLVIENPALADPGRFWRSLLSARLYSAWKLLGWADCVPYDRAQAITIADRIGVSFDALPCAVLVSPRDLRAQKVVRLGGDLTADFRTLLSSFQYVGRRERIRGWARGVDTAPSSDPWASPRRKCFLSHAASDRRLVREVAVALQSVGYDIWFDEWEISYGGEIVGRIESGLASCDTVVVFLSPASVASAWVVREFRAALSAHVSTGKFRAIIPVLLEPCEIPPLLMDLRRVSCGREPALIASALADCFREDEESPSS